MSHGCKVCGSAVRSADEGLVFRVGARSFALCTHHARIYSRCNRLQLTRPALSQPLLQFMRDDTPSMRSRAASSASSLVHEEGVMGE